MTVKSIREVARERIEQIKTDADFDAFVVDHYHEIYQRFSGGMDRVAKANLLLTLADPHTIVSQLSGVKQSSGPAMSPTSDGSCADRGDHRYWDDKAVKQWEGEWVDADFKYTFKLILQRENHSVHGHFLWTLVVAPRRGRARGLSQYIGQQTSELVKGSFDPRTGVLDLEGLEVADRVLTTQDKYALRLNAEGYLSGTSRGDLGRWDSVLRGNLVDVLSRSVRGGSQC